MENVKIDRRISYKVVLDTETCPVDKVLAKSAVLPSNMWVYDMGWAIVDKRGKVYRTRSFVNADIFLGEKDLMQSAYYANKVPNYWEEIKKGERILTSFYNIRKTFLEDIREFGVTECFAHNMRFDYVTLNTTQRWLTKSQFRYFFPRDLVICDTLKMSRDVILKMPTYRNFCERHSLLTQNGRLSATAENLYRFITKNPEYVENHTGLEDVLIEKEILAYCYKQHKKMRRVLWE